jgi:isochorismate synthase
VNPPIDLRAVTHPVEPELAAKLEPVLERVCVSARTTGKDPLGVLAGFKDRGATFRTRRRFIAVLGEARSFGSDDERSLGQVVSSELGWIDCEDPICRPGSKPMAIGALAFEPSAQLKELFVPELTFVREDDGTAWVTITGTDTETPGLPELFAARADRKPDVQLWYSNPDDSDDRPGPVRGNSSVDPVIEDTGREDYLDAVSVALGEIAADQIQKVVLARMVTATFPEPIDLVAVLFALRRYEKASTVFAVRNAGRAFVGASPELLVARDGLTLTSVPLAGTVRLTGDRAADQDALARMVASVKETREHQLVVDAVIEELSRWCTSIEMPQAPVAVPFRQLAHLSTPVTGVLESAGHLPSALDLAELLHPTPAVAGAPRAAALDLIRKLEPQGRGLYAGPVGWVDAEGNGEFVIGIRSAEIADRTATVHAGAGIVAGSDPRSELAETDTKLETMLDALRFG